MKELEQLSTIVGDLDIQPLIDASTTTHSTRNDRVNRTMKQQQAEQLNSQYSTIKTDLEGLIQDFKTRLSDAKTTPAVKEQLTETLKTAMVYLEHNQESLYMFKSVYHNMKNTMAEIIETEKQSARLSTVETSAVNPQNATVTATRRPPNKPLPPAPTAEQEALNRAQRTVKNSLSKLSEKINSILANAALQTEARESLAELHKLCASDLPKLVPGINNLDNLKAMNNGIAEVSTLVEAGKVTEAKQEMAKTLYTNIPQVKAGLEQQQAEQKKASSWKRAETSPRQEEDQDKAAPILSSQRRAPTVAAQNNPQTTAPPSSTPRSASTAMDSEDQNAASEKIFQIMRMQAKLAKAELKAAESKVPAPFMEHFRHIIDKKVSVMKERAKHDSNLVAVVEKSAKMAKECLNNPDRKQGLQDIQAILKNTENRVEKAVASSETSPRKK